jgi:hypothetical protein
MKHLLTLGLAASASLSLLAAPNEPSPAWQPEKTWVFAVGVIQFDNPKLASWPDAGRVDEKLLAALRERGVPQNHIVFLKNQEATKANIATRLDAFLRLGGPDDTLLFYYAGHGGRDYSDPKRTHTFVTYDTKSQWTVSSVLDAIQHDFRGHRVVLTADCCHSGSLGIEAARHSGKQEFAVLTSARATSTSTGNWTFTQCLVDLLHGNPLLDLNHDGKITFREAAEYTDAEMAFMEEQRAGHRFEGSFPPEMIMAPAVGKAVGRVGERCEGDDHGTWYRAKILEQKDGRFFVTWPGWPASQNAWLAADHLRPFVPDLVPAGTRVEIEWDGTWYPGVVVQTELGLHLVHYNGYTADDDEWVARKRLRTPGKAPH